MTGSVITIGVLADSSHSDWIIFVMLFMALISVALLVAVPAINAKNPGNLLMGEVTAREYVAIRTLKQGDDVSGETIERILGPPAIEGTAAESTTPQLEPPTQPDYPDEPSPGDET